MEATTTVDDQVEAEHYSAFTMLAAKQLGIELDAAKQFVQDALKEFDDMNHQGVLYNKQGQIIGGENLFITQLLKDEGIYHFCESEVLRQAIQHDPKVGSRQGAFSHAREVCSDSYISYLV